jgi:hypothetical protein
MVDVTTEGDSVVFVVEGIDRLWSFRSRLELPLARSNLEPVPARRCSFRSGLLTLSHFCGASVSRIRTTLSFVTPGSRTSDSESPAYESLKVIPGLVESPQ